MNLAIVYSRACLGIEAPLITIETHLSNGLPSMTIVGLPETAVRESKDRVRSALINSGFEYPQRRITINLAPADLPKAGGRFDLPIALSILAASNQIPAQQLADYEFLGELALSGELRGVQGTLLAAIQCADAGRKLLVPTNNGSEAALASKAEVFTAASLLEATGHLCGTKPLTATQAVKINAGGDPLPDMSDVIGQAGAKRALEIAAAGNHNVLMCGPPGTGKSMLAQRFVSILPALEETQAIEVAAIKSLTSETFDITQWQQRPFRAPHHSASAAALVGGGSNPKPGEISLAHHGVLFLDELPEFSRVALEVLREPLETGSITIARANRHITFPARFQLIAAMNPCACGFDGDSRNHCQCTTTQIQRYRQRLSGPLLDRIDIHIEVTMQTSALFAKRPRARPKTLDQHQALNTSTSIAKRVATARQHQLRRQQTLNAHLSVPQVDEFCQLRNIDRQFLQQATEQLGLSARAYHRVLKLARTIADLEQASQINEAHLLEALGFRKLDRRA